MANFSIEQQASIIKVNGELTRHSINKKNQLSVQKHLIANNMVIDLSGVLKVDTAGLALLLAIVEYCEIKSISFHFSHLSGDLVKLAKLSGVDSFLPTLY